MVTKKQIQQMADIIVEKFNPEKIILFGSYARGDATEDSDVDLFLIKDIDEPRYKRSVPVYNMLVNFRLDLDVLVYTPNEVNEWSEVHEALPTKVQREGLVLYEKSA